MGILEGIVIVTLVVVGAYVGYHAWQDSLNSEGADSHSIDIELYSIFPQEPVLKLHSQIFYSTNF